MDLIAILKIYSDKGNHQGGNWQHDCAVVNELKEKK